MVAAEAKKMKPQAILLAIILSVIAFLLENLPPTPWIEIRQIGFLGFKLPIPIITFINPLGWLIFPLQISALLALSIGVTEKTSYRILTFIIGFLTIAFLKGLPLWVLPT